MGRDSEQVNDHSYGALCIEKRLPVVAIETIRMEECIFQVNSNLQRRKVQFLRRLSVYFKIRFGNSAICPNIEIHQPFQVGVRQAKTSEGAPTPAVLLGLGYSQTPLTQFSCSCILTFFFWLQIIFQCKQNIAASLAKLPVV